MAVSAPSPLNCCEENEEHNKENEKAVFAPSLLKNCDECKEYNKENEKVAFAPSPLTHCTENEEQNKENENDTSQEFSNNVDKKMKCDRSWFYKKPIKKDNIRLLLEFTETPQEIRRRKLLAYQKENRNASYHAARGMLEVIMNTELPFKDMNEMEKMEEMEEVEDLEKVEEVVEEEDLEESHETEEMEVEEAVVKRKRRRRYQCYSNKLMMSEWMLEVPEDFADKWIMVPCPVGKRALVVAYKGSTKIFTRQGYFLCKFNSALPGGSQKTNTRNLCTILDCIWVKDQKKCYVLDVIVWSTQCMVDCESEFRFFWLKSRMEEISELSEEKEGINEVLFSFLPTINCNENFYPFLENISSSFTIDGLLFYHKEAHYTENRSPLVTWLKPYMLPDALGIAVPEPYNEKPCNYIDFQHHVQKVIHNEKLKIEKQSRKKEQRSLKKKTPEKENLQESME